MELKPLYSKMLRDLELDVEIDTLDIHQSAITYEEKLPKREKAGKLEFDDLEVLITDINNVDTAKTTKIAIDTKFMKQAPLHIDWAFDIHNPYDKFTISGNLGTVKLDELNDFVEPSMKVYVNGSVTALMFNFYGNDSKAKGVLTMKYKDLKVDVYSKKHPKKKNKVLSALANLFLENHQKEYKEQEIEVERVKYKSFFNYFWLCVQDGVKKSIL